MASQKSKAHELRIDNQGSPILYEFQFCSFNCPSCSGKTATSKQVEKQIDKGAASANHPPQLT